MIFAGPDFKSCNFSILRGTEITPSALFAELPFTRTFANFAFGKKMVAVVLGGITTSR